MSPASEVEPLARGTLAERPFGELVLCLIEEGFSGTLVVQHSGREVRVAFRSGVLKAAGPLERGTSLERGLLPLCGWLEASYAVYAEDLLGEGHGLTRGAFDPFAFLRAALKRHLRDSVVDAMLERYQGVRLRLQGGIDLRALGLRGQEAGLVQSLRSAPQTAQAICAAGRLPQPEVRRLLYLLLLTKRLVPDSRHGATNTSHVRMRAVSTMPPPPQSVIPAAPAAAVEVRPSRSRPPATAGSVHPGARPAWQQLASRHHSSAPPERPSARSSAPPIQALDSAAKLQRIERLVANRAYQRAVDAARVLAAEEPDSAEVHAMHAWALHVSARAGKVSPDLVAALNRALRLHPEHPRALYTKALTLQRLGRDADALRYFQRTVRADPSHIEARRQLRLAAMRRKTSRTKK